MFAEEIQQIRQLRQTPSNHNLANLGLNIPEDLVQNWSFDIPETGPEAKRRRTRENDDGHLRCPNYTDEENFLIAHMFKEHQEILKDHRNTTKINKLKNAVWQLIADTISSRPGSTQRTAEQVRRRWKTMLGQERTLDAILAKYQNAILNKDVKKISTTSGTSTPSQDVKTEFSSSSDFPAENEWLNNALKSNLDNFLAMLNSFNSNQNGNDDNQSSVQDEQEDDPEASSSFIVKRESPENEEPSVTTADALNSKNSNFTVEILAGASLNDQILQSLPRNSTQNPAPSQNGFVNGEDSRKSMERNTTTPNTATAMMDSSLKNLLNPQNLRQNYYSLAFKADKELKEAKAKAEDEKKRKDDELFQLQLEKERAQIRLFDSQRELAEAQTYLTKLKTKMLEESLGKEPKNVVEQEITETKVNGLD